MAKARFVSGDVRLDVSFNERTNQYKVRLCPLKGAKRCEVQHVGLPGAGPTNIRGRRISVDDPRAMRNAAHAALSFAADERSSLADQATSNRRGTGWFIRPLRARRRSRR